MDAEVSKGLESDCDAEVDEDLDSGGLAIYEQEPEVGKKIEACRREDSVVPGESRDVPQNHHVSPHLRQTYLMDGVEYQLHIDSVHVSHPCCEVGAAHLPGFLKETTTFGRLEIIASRSGQSAYLVWSPPS